MPTLIVSKRLLINATKTKLAALLAALLADKVTPVDVYETLFKFLNLQKYLKDSVLNIYDVDNNLLVTLPCKFKETPYGLELKKSVSADPILSGRYSYAVLESKKGDVKFTLDPWDLKMYSKDLYTDCSFHFQTCTIKL